MTRFLAAAAALALSAAPALGQSAAPNLTRLVSFETDGAPDLSGPARTLTSSLWSEDRIALPGVGLLPVSHRQAAGRDWTENEVRLSGLWNGLQLRGLGADGVPNSGVGQYRLEFADSPGRVAAVVQRLGLSLGEQEDEEGCRTVTRVDPLGSGSRLTLAFSC